MRYFIVFYNYVGCLESNLSRCGGDGSSILTAEGESFLNKKEAIASLKEMLKEDYGIVNVDVVFTNILEISEEDFKEYTR